MTGSPVLVQIVGALCPAGYAADWSLKTKTNAGDAR
jgi:hypothetical protein